MNASQGLAFVHHLRRCVGTNPRGWCGSSPSLWRGCINTSRRIRRHMTVPFCLFFWCCIFPPTAPVCFHCLFTLVHLPTTSHDKQSLGKFSVFWATQWNLGVKRSLKKKKLHLKSAIDSVDVIQRYGNIIDIQYMCMPQSIIDIQYNTIRLNSRLFSRIVFFNGKRKQ